MDRDTLRRVAAVGFVMNAVQFGLMYVAFDLGLGATLASLLHALSPVLTALLAAAILGERVSTLQVAGFAIGVVGVLLVLGADLGPRRWPGRGARRVPQHAHAQPRHPRPALDRRAARPALVGRGAVRRVRSPAARARWITEGAWPVTDTRQAVVAVLFLAVVNSIVGLVLLALLVLRGGSGAAASLFFLSPPVTAVLAWLVLDETLSPTQLVGLVVAVVGVGAATRTRSYAGAGPRVLEGP